MSAKNDSKKAIDFSHLGGRQVQGPFVPEKSSGKVSFEHIGGRCVLPASDASEEEDGDAKTD
jgi:hypothetical protein